MSKRSGRSSTRSGLPRNDIPTSETLGETNHPKNGHPLPERLDITLREDTSK